MPEMSWSEIVPIVAVIVLIGLIVLCLWRPHALRVVARIFAALASGAGVTGFVAGIIFLKSGSRHYGEKESIWILAGGAGLFVSGIVALVLSFVGKRPNPEDAGEK